MKKEEIKSFPIDFSGYFRWVNTDYVSDYVKVSATQLNLSYYREYQN